MDIKASNSAWSGICKCGSKRNPELQLLVTWHPQQTTDVAFTWIVTLDGWSLNQDVSVQTGGTICDFVQPTLGMLQLPPAPERNWFCCSWDLDLETYSEATHWSWFSPSMQKGWQMICWIWGSSCLKLICWMKEPHVVNGCSWEEMWTHLKDIGAPERCPLLTWRALLTRMLMMTRGSYSDCGEQHLSY